MKSNQGFLVWFMAAIMAVSALALAGCGKTDEELVREAVNAEIEAVTETFKERADDAVVSASMKENFEKMGVDTDLLVEKLMDFSYEIENIEVS